MGFSTNVGKYNLRRTIGEGSFAKVKLALNTETGQSVAIKIIDKQMVMDKRLMDQVKREISTMKRLHHPNIVRIYEVIATKTKIYIVMEYVTGGQLADKMSYTRRLSEDEARKYFQQLIDAVDYCHCRGVYHRDLKPENLLLDNKGNLKVTDFGLSVLTKPGDVLTTSCGSPSYVAPEVIANKSYEGSAADIWSCGVILFELLSGFLPFDDRNLISLYRKMSIAEYTCPEWFTANQRKLIFKILDPYPRKDNEKLKTRLGSWHSIHETIEKIEVAAKDTQLSVERLNNSKVKLHNKRRLLKCRSSGTLSAEIIEVTPTNCVVEIAQSAAELTVYKEFCRSLSSILKEKSGTSMEFQRSAPAISIVEKDTQTTECSQSECKSGDRKHLERGYSSS